MAAVNYACERCASFGNDRLRLIGAVSAQRQARHDFGGSNIMSDFVGRRDGGGATGNTFGLVDEIAPARAHHFT